VQGAFSLDQVTSLFRKGMKMVWILSRRDPHSLLPVFIFRENGGNGMLSPRWYKSLLLGFTPAQLFFAV
jgi:hypothetical protein